MFIVPTWKRPEKLRRLFRALRETETTAPGLVCIQGDDQLPAYKDVIEERPSNWEWMCTDTNYGWVKILNMLPCIRPQLEWYGVINDDHAPVTKHWDRLMLSLCGPWNVVSCLDNSREIQWRASGPLLAGGEMVRTCGFFMPPCTWHICGDDWWQLVGRAFSIWKVAANVRVDQPDSAIFAIDHGLTAGDETHDSSYRDFGTQIAQYHRWVAEYGGDIMARLRIVMQAAGALPDSETGRFVIAKEIDDGVDRIRQSIFCSQSAAAISDQNSGSRGNGKGIPFTGPTFEDQAPNHRLESPEQH